MLGVSSCFGISGQGRCTHVDGGPFGSIAGFTKVHDREACAWHDDPSDPCNIGKQHKDVPHACMHAIAMSSVPGDRLLCFGMLHYATLRYAMQSYATPRYATLCKAMLRYAILCYATLRHAMLALRVPAFGRKKTPNWGRAGFI